MVTVTLDVPAEILNAYQDRATTLGVTTERCMVQVLATINPYSAKIEWVRDRVATLVVQGHCDAEIASNLHMTPGRVAELRRSKGLPANPRYKKAST